VLVLGREKEGIPPEIIALLDATVEIPQLGVIRSLNVHVSGAIAMYEYTKQRLGRAGRNWLSRECSCHSGPPVSKGRDGSVML
jgi:tRNA C32,U32 (ribose-2'-O)-methylase TrmJ